MIEALKPVLFWLACSAVGLLLTLAIFGAIGWVMTKGPDLLQGILIIVIAVYLIGGIAYIFINLFIGKLVDHPIDPEYDYGLDRYSWVIPLNTSS